MTSENTLVKSINPTLHLKKVNFDVISANYAAGIYSSIPAITHKPNVSMFLGVTINTEDKPIGFSINLGNFVVVLKGKNTRYNICGACKHEYKGFCGFGIPTSLVQQEINGLKYFIFTVTGETCSTECTFSLIKLSKCKSFRLSCRYIDPETAIKLIHYLVFGEELNSLKEAPDPLCLIPMGITTINEYRKKLHMIPEYIELKPINNEIIENKKSVIINIK
jgi:hypothetical protein